MFPTVLAPSCRQKSAPVRLKPCKCNKITLIKKDRLQRKCHFLRNSPASSESVTLRSPRHICREIPNIGST